ncbi:2-dehydropantoate 2-reductase [Pararhodospirillum oryzae]|uniref:2-dehydropantoate 2-reductase n=1 Tax=Pararhodospirillum oryzae TaxID=478448 RepID=A0A512H3V8_9PROT|nr:2-dehydropantoate 2-reductase [Pararhodospirillum oryzae]GEO80113.1 2-dehydropantoate 2-reductase [Pararhodospirillum oryzae]
MPSPPSPCVAIIGAGAIGGLFAAALHEAGVAVVVCARGALETLSVEYEGETRVLPVRVITDPASVTPVDWVIVATKAHDTPLIAPWLARLLGPSTPVVVAQNGIDHEARLRPLVGERPIVPALVYVAIERTAPGHIVHHTGHDVVVPADAAAQAFARLMAPGSLLSVRTEADFLTAAWRKLLTNVAANPITTLTLRRMDVMAEPGINALARALMAEAVATGQAAGARLSADDVEDVMTIYRGVNPSGGSSMLYDRLRGAPLEHAHLTGAVVETARRHGVGVPLNEAVLALLEALDRGLQDTRP